MTPQWWDRRSAAQVHLMGMAAFTAWALLVTSLPRRTSSDWWPLHWLFYVAILAVPRWFTWWRFGGRVQVRLMQRALSEMGVPSGADVDRWRPYLESRIRQRSRLWASVAVAYGAALVIVLAIVHDGDLVALGVFALAVGALVGFFALLRRGGPPTPGVKQWRYVLDHLPEHTDESRVAR